MSETSFAPAPEFGSWEFGTEYGLRATPAENPYSLPLEENDTLGADMNGRGNGDTPPGSDETPSDDSSDPTHEAEEQYGGGRVPSEFLPKPEEDE